MKTSSRATISSLAKLEMAREKARIMERNLVTTLSTREQAAQQWQQPKEPGPGVWPAAKQGSARR